MAAPTIAPANAAIGHGYLWTAPSATAKPADTILFGDDMLSPWTYIGGTLEGWTVGSETETNFHYFEEQQSPVKATPGNGTISVSATLGEVTMANLLIAAGGGSLNTASGITTLTLTDTATEFAVLLDGPNSIGKFKRIYIPSATVTSNLELAFRRTESIQGYAVTFQSTCLRSAIKIVNDDA